MCKKLGGKADEKKKSRDLFIIDFFLNIANRLILILLIVMIINQAYIYIKQIINYPNYLMIDKNYNSQFNDVEYIKFRFNQDIDNYSIEVNGRDGDFSIIDNNTIILEVRNNDIIHILNNNNQMINSYVTIVECGNKIVNFKKGQTFKLNKHINTIGVVNYIYEMR